jgi:hypothetical protein
VFMETSIDARLPDHQWHRLASHLLSTMAHEVPGWTDQNVGEPGIAIIELFAFLADELILRSDAIPARGRSRLVEVADKLVSLSEGRDAAGISVFVDGRPWTQTGTLAGAAPTERVFEVTEDGTVVFGDGEHGTTPSGSTVSVTYRQGGGAAGSVGISVTARWPPRVSRHLVSVDPLRGIKIAEVTTEAGRSTVVSTE